MALPGRPKQVVSDPLGSSRFVVGGGSDLRLYEWTVCNDVSRFNTLAACTELGQIRSFAWSPHKSIPNLIAAGMHAGRVVLIRLDSSLPAQSPLASPSAAQINVRHARPCNIVAFADEQPGLLAVGLDKGRGESLFLYDVERSASHLSAPNNAPRLTAEHSPSSNDISSPILAVGSSESVSSAAFLSPAGPSGSSPLLAVGMAGKYLRVYDARAARPLVATWGSRSCHCMSANPFNGHQFVSSADDGVVRLWDIRKSMDPLVSFSEVDAGAVSARVKPTVVAKALVEIGWSKTQRGILTTLERDSHSLRIWNIVEGVESKSAAEGDSEELSRGGDNVRLPIVLSDRRPPDFQHSLASFAFLPSPSNSLKTHFIGVSRDASIPGNSGHMLEVVDVPMAHQAVFTMKGLVITDPTTPTGLHSEEAATPDPRANALPNERNVVLTSVPLARSTSKDKSALRVLPPLQLPSHRGPASPSDPQREERLRVLASDVSSVAAKRIEMGYGSDAAVNAQVTEAPLADFWSWIARAELLARDSFIGEHDFRYRGVIPLLVGLNVDVHGSGQFGSRSSGRNSPATASPRTIYSDVTRSLRKGDEAQSKNAAYADAAAQLVARRKLDNAFSTSSSSLMNQRKLAMQCCGVDWEEDQDLVCARFARAEDFEAAARHAFFSGHLEKSMAYLKNCSSDSVKMLAPLLAAYLAQRESKDRDGQFSDLCRSLSSDMEAPWVRAMLAFLASGDWRELVDETGLPIRDRVAVALRFLSDSELLPFLHDLASEALTTGDLEAVLLFGLRTEGLKLLSSYLDRTADLQTVALAAAFVSPGLVRDDRRVTRWIQSYRTLLDHLRLYAPRAIYDISRSRRARAAMDQARSAGRVAELMDVDKALRKAAPPQMILRCQFCSANIAPASPALNLAASERGATTSVGIKCARAAAKLCQDARSAFKSPRFSLLAVHHPSYRGARDVVMEDTPITSSPGSTGAQCVQLRIATVSAVADPCDPGSAGPPTVVRTNLDVSTIYRFLFSMRTTIERGSTAKRDKFVGRLHRALGFDHNDLRWIGNDRFEIAADDSRARRALASEFDFRSLSSFVRQLSYYGFKRLSDRRRSVDKNGDDCPHVVFAHPSGNFLRDDPDRLRLITRRPRMRKSNPNGTGRGHKRASTSEPPVQNEDLPRDVDNESVPSWNMATISGNVNIPEDTSNSTLQRASWPGLRLPMQSAGITSWTSPYPSPNQYSPTYTESCYSYDYQTSPLDTVERSEYFSASADKPGSMPALAVPPPNLLSPVSHNGTGSRRASACSALSYNSMGSAAFSPPSNRPSAMDYFSVPAAQQHVVLPAAWAPASTYNRATVYTSPRSSIASVHSSSQKYTASSFVPTSIAPEQTALPQAPYPSTTAWVMASTQAMSPYSSTPYSSTPYSSTPYSSTSQSSFAVLEQPLYPSHFVTQGCTL
ncbi:hypothetical protein OIO90_003739 [Microbotryomycetes sp. JL221]|nr:hypothetical protein OIO90_003739 [Microbotryomycetes sp. JL221]